MCTIIMHEGRVSVHACVQSRECVQSVGSCAASTFFFFSLTCICQRGGHHERAMIFNHFASVKTLFKLSVTVKVYIMQSKLTGPNLKNF